MNLTYKQIFRIIWIGIFYPRQFSLSELSEKANKIARAEGYTYVNVEASYMKFKDTGKQELKLRIYAAIGQEVGDQVTGTNPELVLAEFQEMVTRNSKKELLPAQEVFV